MKVIKGTFLLLFIFFAACEHRDVRQIPNRQGLIADKAMVVSAHPLASQVGVDIMKAGGNAVDAAIAVHFALAVVHPAAGNIGGGGFMVYRTQAGEYHTLDYREKAPAAASRNMYLNEAGDVDPKKAGWAIWRQGCPDQWMGWLKHIKNLVPGPGVSLSFPRSGWQEKVLH
jgi:gamma-glutamyltranspeptidase/glutathione hydrolase